MREEASKLSAQICTDTLGWPGAIVAVAVILGLAIVGYAFCRYVLGSL